MITQLLRPKSGQLDIHFSSYQQKPRFLAKNSKICPEKEKVVRHFGKNNQIDKKMLSVRQNYNPHLWAKFGKDPICSF